MKKKVTSKSTYWEKLKDPRWQKKRLEVLDRAEFTCESCGDKDSTLHVHHIAYRKGAEPWEYDSCDELQCLCEDCHASEHDLDRRLDDALYEFKTTAAMCGHTKDELIGFLQAAVFGFGPHKEDLEITSYEHAAGIAQYYELGRDGANQIIGLARDNGGVLNHCAFIWAFHADERAETLLRILNNNPVKFSENVVLERINSKFWPNEFKLLVNQRLHQLELPGLKWTYELQEM